MPNWLIKSESSVYSIEDLKRDGSTAWDGVRNYQARNNLSAMKIGDLAMIYHSVGPKELVGIAKVIKSSYPDPSATEDVWVAVDIAFQKYSARPVKLLELKSIPELCDLSLVRQGRLSVCPLSKIEWDIILSLAKS